MNLDDLDLHTQQLAGGISQQPAHIRFPGQVEDAENVDFSVADGIRKRPGTIYAFRVTGLTASAQYRIHGIERDQDEHYLAILGAGVLKVFSTAGVAATITDVSDAGAADAYLDANSAGGEDMRVLSIADTTIIANTTVPLATANTPTFTVTSEWGSYSLMRSSTPAAQTYHRVTGDEADFPAGYYFYDPSPDISGDVTFAVATFNTVSGGPWNSPAGNWDNAGAYGFRIHFQRRNIASTTGWTFTNATKRLTKAASNAFDDYIWRFNDKVHITGGTGVTAGWYAVARRIDADTIELTDSIAGGGSPTNVSIDAVGDEYDVYHITDGTTLNDMNAVAKSLENSLRSAGCDDGLIAWETLSGGAGRFKITCPYRGSTRTIYDIASPAGGTDLTVTGGPFNSFTVAVGTGSGDPVLAVDSRWTRVAPPNSADGSINETAAPVKLSRTLLSPLTFELDTIDWNDRIEGDADSNPSPDIFKEGRYVSDLCYHRGRFGIGAGDTLVLSQAGDLFNFYLEDPDDPVDSDPIVLQISSDRVAVIDYLIPWRSTLAIFTRAGRQYELTNPEALTPTTAGFESSTHYPTRQVRPGSMGSRMYFATDQGARTGLREYYRDEQAVASDAFDVTAHVPRLIPQQAQTIVVHAPTHRVFLLERSTSTIFVYRSFFVGSSRQQSAWSRWTFQANTRVVDIAIIGDNLWLLIERPGGEYAFEYIPLGDRVPDSGMPYVVHLDRQKAILGVFDGTKTTWTLPTGYSDTSINTIAQGPTAGVAAGQWFNVNNQAGTSIFVAGNYATGAVYVGRRFPASVTLTRPFVRDGQGNADLRRSLLMRKINVAFEPSGDFDVAYDAPPRATTAQQFRPDGDFKSTRGTFQAWPCGDVENVTVRIESLAPTPLTVTGIQRTCDIGEVAR